MTPNSHGVLMIVGLGPGSAGLMTPDAAEAIARAEVVVGYRGYLDQIADRLAGKDVVRSALGHEVERAGDALAMAEAGRVVALVSSGDAGIYGMGGVALELAISTASPAEVVVIPGVTAALAAASRLGAPLAHDWACVSLSTLLTPWDVILARVTAAAQADFVLVFYNPTSRERRWQLPAAVDRLLMHRDPATPVGLVENAYRPEERVEVVRLDELARANVNMFTTIIVGSSRTISRDGRMVTPRIFAAKTDRAADDPPKEAPPTSPAGDAIMAESLAIIEHELGPDPVDPARREVVKRVIHASADFDFADSLRFSRSAIERAVDAFSCRRAAIVTDVEMLLSGVRRDLAASLEIEALCGLNLPEVPALVASTGLTRSAAGMRLIASRVGDGAIVAIGNAPSALEEALDLIERDRWRPACLIGIPVGFVGVEAAKRRLMEQDAVPFITSLGRKGGTAVTAAVVNALLTLARDEPGP